MSSCSDAGIGFIIRIIKTVFTIVEVAAPIVLIISLIILFTKMLTNPDQDKKLLINVKNAIVACMIIFLIPALVNLTMTILGEKFTVSECWNNPYKSSDKGKYIPKNTGDKDKKPTKVYDDKSS